MIADINPVPRVETGKTPKITCIIDRSNASARLTSLITHTRWRFSVDVRAILQQQLRHSEMAMLCRCTQHPQAQAASSGVVQIALPETDRVFRLPR